MSSLPKSLDPTVTLASTSRVANPQLNPPPPAGKPNEPGVLSEMEGFDWLLVVLAAGFAAYKSTSWQSETAAAFITFPGLLLVLIGWCLLLKMIILGVGEAEAAKVWSKVVEAVSLWLIGIIVTALAT